LSVQKGGGGEESQGTSKGGGKGSLPHSVMYKVLREKKSESFIVLVYSVEGGKGGEFPCQCKRKGGEMGAKTVSEQGRKESILNSERKGKGESFQGEGSYAKREEERYRWQ